MGECFKKSLRKLLRNYT